MMRVAKVFSMLFILNITPSPLFYGSVLPSTRAFSSGFASLTSSNTGWYTSCIVLLLAASSAIFFNGISGDVRRYFCPVYLCKSEPRLFNAFNDFFILSFSGMVFVPASVFDVSTNHTQGDYIYCLRANCIPITMAEYYGLCGVFLSAPSIIACFFS